MFKSFLACTLLLTLAACQLAPAPAPTPSPVAGRPTRIPASPAASAPGPTSATLSGATAGPGPTPTPLVLQPVTPAPGASAIPTLAATQPGLPATAAPAVAAAFVRPATCLLLPSVQRLPGLRLGAELRLTADLAGQIARAEQLGARWTSLPVSWAAFEPQRGQLRLADLDGLVDLIVQSGQTPILVLRDTPAWAGGDDVLAQQPDDLAAFLGALADRYQNKVGAYQIFELPNAPADGRPAASPQRYAEALLAGSAAVRAADPCALVLAGGLLPNRDKDPLSGLDDLTYLQKLLAYDDGAVKAAYDALAVPLLTGDTPPGEHSKQQDERHRRFTYLERLRNELVFQGEAGKPIWVSLGWPQAAGGPEHAGVDADEQAVYMERALERIAERHPWIALVLVRGLSAEAPATGEADYRIVDASGAPLAAYRAIAATRALPRQPGPRQGFAGPADLGLLWTYDGIAEPAPGSALGPDGALRIGTGGQWSYAIDTNGAFRWSYRLGGQQAISGMAIDRQGTTYIGSDKNLLVAVAADSSTRWDLLLPEPMSRAPTVAGSRLFVPLLTSLAAVDTASGTLLWVAPLGGGPGRVGVGGEGEVYVGTTDGVLHALSADGQPRWTFRSERWVRGAPVQTRDGQVIAASDGGTVFALDQAGGLRWRFDGVGALTTRASEGGDGTLYLPSSEGLLYALTPAGTLRWQAELPGAAAFAANIAKDGTILVAAGRSLLGLDAAGNLRWRFDAATPLASAPQISPDEIVIVADEAGTIYGLGPLALRDRLGW